MIINVISLIEEHINSRIGNYRYQIGPVYTLLHVPGAQWMFSDFVNPEVVIRGVIPDSEDFKLTVF